MSETEKTSATVDATSDWDKPGTKKWFWSMRLLNVLLIIAPTYPLIDVFFNLHQAQASIRTTDPGVHATSPDGRVEAVIVNLAHPSAVDYLLLTAPDVIGFLVLAVICRALYRIAVNFSGNERPYTERDAKVLNIATRAAGMGWFVLLPFLFSSALRYHGGGNPNTGNYMTLFVILGAVMLYVKSMYDKGRSFYLELEKGV